MHSKEIINQAKAFQRLHPEEYMKRFHQHGIRPDGRKFEEQRTRSIINGTLTSAEGSSIVRIGKTTFICGIKAEVAEPTNEETTKGFLIPNVQMGPLCSSEIQNGPPNESSMVYSEIINKLIQSNQLIDLNTLCIEEGIAVWCLHIDLICLADDGNSLDVSLLAFINALKNVKLPKAYFDEDSGIVKANKEESQPLELLNTFYPLTFGMIDKNSLLTDPSHLEEQLLKSSITMVINSNLDKMLYTYKIGPEPISQELITKCWDHIQVAAQEYFDEN